MHLLIADDHQAVADGLGALLASEFDTIHYAATPEEAEGLLAQHSFDLILLDLDFRRPDRNGFHILEAAIRRDPGAKALILSQFDDPSLIDRARKLGAAGYLSKDAGRATIQEAVAAVLQEKRWFPGPGESKTNFTPKQILVMHHLAVGLERKEIAREMRVSTPMIDTHLAAIQRKLGVHGLRATIAEIERRALHLLGA